MFITFIYPYKLQTKMKKIFFTFLTVLLATMAAQAATDYGFEVAGVTVTSAKRPPTMASRWQESR